MKLINFRIIFNKKYSVNRIIYDTIFHLTLLFFTIL